MVFTTKRAAIDTRKQDEERAVEYCYSFMVMRSLHSIEKGREEKRQVCITLPVCTVGMCAQRQGHTHWEECLALKDGREQSGDSAQSRSYFLLKVNPSASALTLEHHRRGYESS